MTRQIIIVVAGLPGAGKSTVARAISQRIGAVHLRNDVIRKELFSAPAYTPEEARVVYDELFLRAQALVRRSNVVVDAMFLKESDRRAIQHLAQEAGCDFFLLHLVCPDDIVKERLAYRTNDASDATFQEFLEKKPLWENIQIPHFVIDTSHNVEDQIARLPIFFK